MQLSDFDYDLPEDRIAQEPSPRRDGSRLMLVDRASGQIRHHAFSELPQLLTPQDLVVLNDTRVFPARLTGTAGRRTIEVLLVREQTPGVWEVLLKPARKAPPGKKIRFGQGLRARVIHKTETPIRVVKFSPVDNLQEKIDQLGCIPLPPYIRRQDPKQGGQDGERYQTVFGRERGSIAGPTAGFHFTRELLEQIPHTFLTLHIGYGTFQPIRSEQVLEHRMESEAYRLCAATAEQITAHKQQGGSVVAVGSTCTRVLEHVYGRHGTLCEDAGQTDLFICPGFHFGVVDTLLTNFHLPRSTLFLLVCAFAGRELMQEAYGVAIREGYRFYSYGDAMLIR